MKNWERCFQWTLIPQLLRRLEAHQQHNITNPFIPTYHWQHHQQASSPASSQPTLSPSSSSRWHLPSAMFVTFLQDFTILLTLCFANIYNSWSGFGVFREYTIVLDIGYLAHSLQSGWVCLSFGHLFCVCLVWPDSKHGRVLYKRVFFAFSFMRIINISCLFHGTEKIPFPSCDCLQGALAI